MYLIILYTQLSYGLKGRTTAGKSKFGTRREEYLNTLRLPEFTVDFYSNSSYGYDWRRLDPELPPLARN